MFPFIYAIPDALLHYFSHFCPQHLPKWNWKLLNSLITKHLTGSFVLGTIVNYSLVQILFSVAYRQFLVFLIFLLVTILKRHLPSSSLYPIPILVSASTPGNSFSSSPLTSYLYTSGCIFPFFCTIITGIFTAIPINSLDPNPTCLCPYLVYGHSSKHLGVFLHSAPFYLPFISFSYHLNFQKCSKFLLSLTK